MQVDIIPFEGLEGFGHTVGFRTSAEGFVSAMGRRIKGITIVDISPRDLLIW